MLCGIWLYMVFSIMLHLYIPPIISIACHAKKVIWRRKNNKAPKIQLSGIWCWCWAVPDISEDCSAFICRVQQSKTGLLDCKDEATMIIWSVRNYSPSITSQKAASSGTLLGEPHILHSKELVSQWVGYSLDAFFSMNWSMCWILIGICRDNVAIALLHLSICKLHDI